MTATKRPVITAIKITATMPDGSTQDYQVDPTQVEALFWTKNAAKEILGGFYHGKGKKMTKAEAEKNFGKPMADKVFGNKTDRDLDKALVDEFWETPKNGDTTVAFLGKTPGCFPTNG